MYFKYKYPLCVFLDCLGWSFKGRLHWISAWFLYWKKLVLNDSSLCVCVCFCVFVCSHVTGFHVTAPVSNFNVRKVELTPLEQRKLTFDSHAMVTELENSGEETPPPSPPHSPPQGGRGGAFTVRPERLVFSLLVCVQVLRSSRRSWSSPLWSLWPRPTWTSSTGTWWPNPTRYRTSAQVWYTNLLSIVMKLFCLTGCVCVTFRRLQCSRSWLTWTPSGRTWWSWRRASSPTCALKTPYDDTLYII